MKGSLEKTGRTLFLELAAGALLALGLGVGLAQQPPRLGSALEMELKIIENCMKRSFPDGSQRFTDAEIKGFVDLVRAGAFDLEKHEDEKIQTHSVRFAESIREIICNVTDAKHDPPQQAELKQRPAQAKKKVEALINDKIKGQTKQATAETVRSALGELLIARNSSRQGHTFVRLNLVIDANGNADEDKTAPPAGGTEIDLISLGWLGQIFSCVTPPPPNCPVNRRSFVFGQVKDLLDLAKTDGTLTEAAQKALQWLPLALKHIENHSQKIWEARYLTRLQQTGVQLHCLGVGAAPCVPPAKTAGAFKLAGIFFSNQEMKNFTPWVKALRDDKAIKQELTTKKQIGALLPAWKDNKRQVFYACFDTMDKPGDFARCTSTERITDRSAGGVVCQFFDLKLDKGECRPKPIDWSKL